jgi:PEP-CTERM motif-containing protein
LHPSGFGDSYALAVGGGQQVGFSYDGGGTALLWTGTAESVVNLNPTNLPGITSAQAFGTNGVHQVGEGYGAGHALLWSGTAESAIDLHGFLPPGFAVSQAYTIDAAGTVWGLAYKDLGGGDPHVVKWMPVPEPSSALLGAIGVGAVVLRLRRRAAR